MALMSLAALASACQNAGRAAASFGRNLPDFSAQYSNTATDCESVTGFPPGPSLSTITGICPFGFMATNEAAFFQPDARAHAVRGAGGVEVDHGFRLRDVESSNSKPNRTKIQAQSEGIHRGVVHDKTPFARRKRRSRVHCGSCGPQPRSGRGPDLDRPH